MRLYKQISSPNKLNKRKKSAPIASSHLQKSLRSSEEVRSTNDPPSAPFQNPEISNPEYLQLNPPPSPVPTNPTRVFDRSFHIPFPQTQDLESGQSLPALFAISSQNAQTFEVRLQKLGASSRGVLPKVRSWFFPQLYKPTAVGHQLNSSKYNLGDWNPKHSKTCPLNFKQSSQAVGVWVHTVNPARSWTLLEQGHATSPGKRVKLALDTGDTQARGTLPGHRDLERS